MNTYLPYLQSGSDGEAFNEDELVKIITKNIPQTWRVNFRLARGNKSASVLEAQSTLLLLEKKEKLEEKNKSRDGNNNKSRG